METANIPSNAFVESAETLPASNRRDELMARIDADCKNLREMCWEMRKIYSDYTSARDQYDRDIINGKKPDIDALLEKRGAAAGKEREIYFLKDAIEKAVADWNFDKQLAARIYVSHTAEGLPFAVNKSKKTPIWGS